MGGWCSNKMEPGKKEVYWFHEQIHVEEWGSQAEIAALKMLGTLFLCNMILTHQASVLPGPTPGGQ